MPRNPLLALLALLAVVMASVAAFALSRSTPPTFHGTDLGPGNPAHDFTLEAADRGRVALSEFRGRAVLMFFGYTHCPDVCPLTMGKLRLALERVGASAGDVQVILVTVDPELDTPERLRDYVRTFDPGFIGLTGSREQLEGITRAYGVYAGGPQPVPAGDPAADQDAGADHDGHADHASHQPPPRLIEHTSHLFGIDRRGNFRLLWGGDATAEEIAGDVRQLLRL